MCWAVYRPTTDGWIIEWQSLRRNDVCRGDGEKYHITSRIQTSDGMRLKIACICLYSDPELIDVGADVFMDHNGTSADSSQSKLNLLLRQTKCFFVIVIIIIISNLELPHGECAEDWWANCYNNDHLEESLIHFSLCTLHLIVMRFLALTTVYNCFLFYPRLA